MLQKLDDLLTIIRFLLSIYGRISMRPMFCFRLLKFVFSKRLNPTEKEFDMLLDKWNELQGPLRRAILCCHDVRVGDTCVYVAFTLTIGLRDVKYLLKAETVDYDELENAIKMRHLLVNELVMPLIQEKSRMQAMVNVEINELKKIRK